MIEHRHLMEVIALCFHIAVCVFTFITQKVLKITNYILVNARRHVSAVFTAIFRTSRNTDQVQKVRG
jgi:hypothetical protein